jgi:hypothetical protein
MFQIDVESKEQGFAQFAGRKRKWRRGGRLRGRAPRRLVPNLNHVNEKIRVRHGKNVYSTRSRLVPISCKNGTE